MLHTQVMEEPNIMSVIVRHLSARDTVNLMLSKGEFTDDPRFKDTVIRHLNSQKRLYDKRMEELAFENRKCLFVEQMQLFASRIQEIQGTENRKRIAMEMLDFICANKDIVENPSFYRFKETIHAKLLLFLRDPTSVFYLEALHYLDILFNIKVHAEFVPDTDDEYVEYIVDINGEQIWL